MFYTAEQTICGTHHGTQGWKEERDEGKGRIFTKKVTPQLIPSWHKLKRLNTEAFVRTDGFIRRCGFEVASLDDLGR